MSFSNVQLIKNRFLGNSKRELGARILALFPIAGFFNFFQLAVIGSFSVRPADVLFVVVGILFFLNVISSARINKIAVVAILILSCFSLSALTGLIYENGIFFDCAKFLRFTQTMFWGVFAAYFMRSEVDFLRLVYFIVIIGAVIGFVGVYFLVTVPEVHRIAGFYTVAGGEGFEGQASFNELGAFCSFSMTLAIAIIIQKKNITAMTFWLLIFGVSFSCMGLILTQSRSGLMALIVSLVIFLVLRLFNVNGLKSIKANIRSFLAAAMILVGTMVLVVFIQSISTVDRFMETFQAGSNAYESAMTRLSLWQKGFDYLASDPSYLVVGHGGRWLPANLGPFTLENFFLDTSIAYSLLGSFLVLIYFLYPVVVAEKYSGKNNWLSSLIIISSVIVVVVGMFGNVVVDPFFGGAIFLVLYGAGSVIMAGSKRL